MLKIGICLIGFALMAAIFINRNFVVVVVGVLLIAGMSLVVVSPRVREYDDPSLPETPTRSPDRIRRAKPRIPDSTARRGSDSQDNAPHDTDPPAA